MGVDEFISKYLEKHEKTKQGHTQNKLNIYK